MKLNKQHYQLALILFSLSLFALLAFLPRDWSTPGDPANFDVRLQTITILSPTLYNGIFYISLALALFLLIKAGKLQSTIPRYKTVLLILALVGFPVSCTMAIPNSLGNWTEHGSVSTEDGSTYYFLDSSFLQGQLMAIAKLTNDGIFTNTYKVLIMNNGDSPRSYTYIVREADAENIYGQLYYTVEGILVGVRYDNKCFLAYDLKKGKTYGHSNVQSLSPFILLDKNSKTYQEDVRNIIELGIDDKTIGAPKLESVKAALNHSNPAVREIAATLLKNATHNQQDLE